MTCSSSFFVEPKYLHSAAQAEDAVVCVLGLKALEGGLDNVVLLGEQVIGPVRQSALAIHPQRLTYAAAFAVVSTIHCTTSEGCVPQTELPVPCGIAVPVGQRLHPALEPWALVDKGSERRRRHCFEARRGRVGVGGAGCRQLRVGVVQVVRSVSSSKRKRLNANWGRCGRASLGPRKRLIQHPAGSKLALPASDRLSLVPHRCDV